MNRVILLILAIFITIKSSDFVLEYGNDSFHGNYPPDSSGCVSVIDGLVEIIKIVDTSQDRVIDSLLLYIKTVDSLNKEMKLLQVSVDSIEKLNDSLIIELHEIVRDGTDSIENSISEFEDPIISPYIGGKINLSQGDGGVLFGGSAQATFFFRGRVGINADIGIVGFADSTTYRYAPYGGIGFFIPFRRK